MKRPIRLLFISPAELAVAAFVYIVVELLLRSMAKTLGVSVNDADLEQMAGLRPKLIVAFACYYGLRRVVRFHPILQPSYRQWLESSPWTARRPLPLGAVLLVWQDVLFIGVLTLIGFWSCSIEPTLPATGFGFAYAAASLIVLMPLGRWIESTLILLLFPLIVPHAHERMAPALIAAMLLCTAQVGIWRTLADFPWPKKERKKSPVWIGWPTNAVGPIQSMLSLPRGAGLYIAALIGWWSAVIALNIPDMFTQAARDDVRVACIVVAAVAGVSRIGIFCFRYVPPIGVIGRFKTGRLVIPRYDYVFIAPLLVCLLGIIVPFVGGMMQVSPPTILATSLSLTILLVTEMGPTFDHWRLTGAHAIPHRPANDNQQAMRRSANPSGELRAFRLPGNSTPE